MRGLSHASIVEARDLRRLLWSWHAVADHVGCSVEALKRAMVPGWIEKRQEGARNYRARKAGTRFRPYVPITTHIAESKPVAPQSVLFERERAMLAPRSLTATLLGDPPAGRSALDKRGT
jgi:hypothetical protein